MTEKLIMFGNGYVYELDTVEETLLFVTNDVNDIYNADITGDVPLSPEPNVECFLEKNTEYKVIKGMEE